MVRCKDCDCCGFIEKNDVKFREKHLVYLCKKCFLKREKEVHSHGSNRSNK